MNLCNTFDDKYGITILMGTAIIVVLFLCSNDNL